MGEEEIVERLTRVRGVGRWTVEMLLIFRLGRPDVLPAGDYGIRKGFARAFRTRRLPTPRQVLRRGERWRPYRTVASWYLWRAAAPGAFPGSAPGSRGVHGRLDQLSRRPSGLPALHDASRRDRADLRRARQLGYLVLERRRSLRRDGCAGAGRPCRARRCRGDVRLDRRRRRGARTVGGARPGGDSRRHPRSVPPSLVLPGFPAQGKAGQGRSLLHGPHTRRAGGPAAVRGDHHADQIRKEVRGGTVPGGDPLDVRQSGYRPGRGRRAAGSLLCPAGDHGRRDRTGDTVLMTP